MADMVNLNFRADGDFGPLIAEVNRAMAQLSKFRNTQLLGNLNLNKKDFDAAVMNFRDLVTASGQFSSQIVNVTSSTEQFGKALSKQNLKLKEYYKAYADFRRSASGQIRALAEEQVRVSQSVVKSLGRDMSGAQKALVITPTGIDNLANSAKIGAQQTMIFNKVLRDGATSLINWGKNTQWAGRQLTVGLTLPIMLFGKNASEAFRRADAELTRLAKVYGGIGQTSTAELEKVRMNVTELAKTLASTYGSSFEETLALAADIAATGAEGNDLLAATAETTRLATLGEVDRQEAMKATLALQSAFKLNTVELTQSIDFLNSVENQTSTTLQDLVEAIPKAGPVIKGLGGDVKTLALFLTAMREGGINAAEGANALKSGLGSLINPSKNATERLAGFGINVTEIVNSNAGDLVGLIMDLQKALDQLDPLQKQQAIESLFGKYQFARIGALLNNIGREGSQSLQVLDLMNASTQDLAATADRELKLLTESASGRYKRSLETFKAALSEFGQPFLAIFTNILDVGAKALTLFERMPKPFKMLLTGLAGITAILGPLIMLTGLMGNFIGYIIKGVAAFRQLRSGAGAFELITTATVAADQVADAYTQSTYNQAQAADVLRASLEKLAMAYQDVAMAGAGGPPPPTGGGMIPTGGGIVPTGGGMSGGAIPTSQAFADYRADVDPLNQRALTKKEELQAMLSGMSPEEADAYLRERVKGFQRNVQDKGLATNRASAELMPYAGAGLSALGLMDESMMVSGMYREETGAGNFSLFTAQGGHIDPVEKARLEKELYDRAIASGKSPAEAERLRKSQTSAGPVPMPGKFNEVIGSAPDQDYLMTREGMMAMVVAEDLLNEDYKAAGGKKKSFRERAARYKKAKETVPLAKDIPIADKKDIQKLIDERRVVSSRRAAPTAVPTAGGAVGPQVQAAAAFAAAEEPVKNVEKSVAKTEKSIRQSAKSAARFAGTMGAAVGSAGLAANMLMGMTGTTNQMASNMANFAMTLGFAVPAIQGLGMGLKGVGGSLMKAGGMVGRLGAALSFLGTGPGMIAIGVVTALAFGIKKLNDMYAESLRKARADVSVSEEALNEFGGAALTAASKFKTYVETSKALAKQLIDQKQAQGVPGLPSPDEIAKVEEQVKKLFKDQISRAKGIDTKEQALEFARNLKSTLVAQGVDQKAASTVIASIFEQAGQEEFSIPVLLDIAGITNKDQAMDQLMNAAQKTFDEISKKLTDGGSISQALGERFSSQLDLLSASAINQIKTFEDLDNVINYLPENMKGLTIESLQATTAGQKLLASIQATNPELYDAWERAGNLAAAIQMAAANSMGLTSSLSGVAGQFDIAAQNAMNVVASQAYMQSGLQKYYDKLIQGENNSISALRKRMKNELEAADRRREALDKQIEAERETIDAIKEQASARKEALRAQQESADFEADLNKMRLQQDVALMTGNLAEAAMVGLDIEKKMRDRSVDLAEDAIDQKAEREIKLHEDKLKMLEEEKKAIKDLTDEQKKSIEERYNKLIDKHNKTIAKYRQDATESASTFRKLFEEAAAGSLSAYKQLEELLGKTGNKIDVLGTSFSAFMTKTMESFGKAFGDSLATLLGPDYRVQNGKIQQAYKTPGAKGRGTVTRYKDVTTIAEMFGIPGGGVSVSPDQISNSVNKLSTSFGTFSVKSKDGYDYVEFSKKGDNKVYRIDPYGTDTKITKDRVEAFLTSNGYKASEVMPRQMGGMVKKNYKIQARGNGGMGKVAMPYLVGEVGPELFIPNMNGNVVSSDRLMTAVRSMTTGSSMNGEECNYYINVNVATNADPNQIANAIEAKMKLMNQRVGETRYA